MLTDLWQCALLVLPHWEIKLMAQWPIIPHSHIMPDTAPTLPCPLLLLPSAKLGNDKYQFYCSVLTELGFEFVTFYMWSLSSTHSATASFMHTHIYIYVKLINDDRDMFMPLMTKLKWLHQIKPTGATRINRSISNRSDKCEDRRAAHRDATSLKAGI